MIGGVQYVMEPPASLIWQGMGESSVGELVASAAEQLQGDQEEMLRGAVMAFLLAADRAGLVALYPDEEQQASR